MDLDFWVVLLQFGYLQVISQYWLITAGFYFIVWASMILIPHWFWFSFASSALTEMRTVAWNHLKYRTSYYATKIFENKMG